MPVKTLEQIVDDKVEKGAAWLDYNYPGWLDKVSLDRLNMGQCGNCIIGQAVSMYTETLFEGGHAQACALGFDCDSDTNYSDLEAGWNRKVTELREERE